MLGRIETRTRDRIYCQTIRTVRDISRDDRAIIATCSLRTLTDRLKENYSIDVIMNCVSIIYFSFKIAFRDILERKKVHALFDDFTPCQCLCSVSGI